MTMRIITFLNEKGGTGKTSTSVALATILAQRGWRVLLIDGDSQGHATLATRIKREDRLYHILANNAPFKGNIIPAPVEYTDSDPNTPAKLWVLPSDDGTALIDNKLDIYTLSYRLEELKRVFDMVIIDTSPKPGYLHLMAYLASTWLIYPTVCTFYSMQGLYTSFDHLASFASEKNDDGSAKYNVGDVLGILPTMYAVGRRIQKQNYATLKKKYSEDALFSPMRLLTAWDEAAQNRRPINRLGYDNEAAPEAERFADEVLTRMGVTEHAR